MVPFLPAMCAIMYQKMTLGRKMEDKFKREVKKLNREHDKKIFAMEQKVKIAQRKKANASRAFDMFKDDKRYVKRFINEHEPEIDAAIIQLAGIKHTFNKLKYLDYRTVATDVKVEQKLNKQ